MNQTELSRIAIITDTNSGITRSTGDRSLATLAANLACMV